MPSIKPIIAIRTSSKVIEKFKFIADEENRSMANLGEKLIKDYIRQYEQEHGAIEL